MKETRGMQETMEKPPGVYVRANETPPAHELDMLWAGNRGFHVPEERSPILFFAFGFLIGAVLTAAVAFFFFIQPNIQVGDSVLTQPTVEQELQADTQAAPTEATGAPPQTTAPASSSSATTTGASTVGGVKAQRHTVQNGDTLGSIALRYYGSSAPMYIDKLTRANKLTNPNSLKLDQELIVPPKDY